MVDMNEARSRLEMAKELEKATKLLNQLVNAGPMNNYQLDCVLQIGKHLGNVNAEIQKRNNAFQRIIETLEKTKCE